MCQSSWLHDTAKCMQISLWAFEGCVHVIDSCTVYKINNPLLGLLLTECLTEICWIVLRRQGAVSNKSRECFALSRTETFFTLIINKKKSLQLLSILSRDAFHPITWRVRGNTKKAYIRKPSLCNNTNAYLCYMYGIFADDYNVTLGDEDVFQSA